MMVQGFCTSLVTSAGSANQCMKSQGFPCIKKAKTPNSFTSTNRAKLMYMSLVRLLPFRNCLLNSSIISKNADYFYANT